MYFVYILRCSDGTYYTGITNNLEKRVSEHIKGLDSKAYTYHRRPVALVWNEFFPEISEALRAEKQIKGWGRKKKEALLNGDFGRLTLLSRGRKGYMKISKKAVHV